MVAHRLREGVPIPVAAMQLLMQADTPEAARSALECVDAPIHGQLRRVADLIASNPDAWHTVRRLAGSARHAPVEGDAVAQWSELFDRLVRISPEGSVALYSLGSAQLLAEATGEIVTMLDAWGLLREAAAVLDIGCGIGRLEAALSARVAAITGLDIAPAMLDEARRRCGALPNVDFRRCSGSDLRGIANESVDLVALVDTLPYLILSGIEIAASLLADSARVLRPGGSVLVLNFSYRDDADADLADLARLAARGGLHFLRADWRPFESWDAPAFQLVKR
jgi:SAM-dependent methyltransferase